MTGENGIRSALKETAEVLIGRSLSPNEVDGLVELYWKASGNRYRRAISALTTEFSSLTESVIGQKRAASDNTDRVFNSLISTRIRKGPIGWRVFAWYVRRMASSSRYGRAWKWSVCRWFANRWLQKTARAFQIMIEQYRAGGEDFTVSDSDRFRRAAHFAFGYMVSGELSKPADWDETTLLTVAAEINDYHFFKLHMRQRPEVVIPILIRHLEITPDPPLKMARILQDIGPKAKAALPALREWAEKSAFDSFKEAIAAIDPHECAPHLWQRNCVCKECRKRLSDVYKDSIVRSERTIPLRGTGLPTILGEGVPGAMQVIRVGIKADIVKEFAESISEEEWSDLPALLIACNVAGFPPSAAEHLFGIRTHEAYRITRDQASLHVQINAKDLRQMH